ncbi:hypothetical protein LCGC14_0783670 [marine sediment metagenome]|uniref:RecA family profile 1 domain-containing protein n=1 Tax=marine sediment metagenome TaxID=412755 RepID=A0A0F9PYZ7_9ZZZZ
MKFPTSKINTLAKNFESEKGIYSVWGDFGVGKTTFVLQTALNATINGNKVILIYTKSNFPTFKIKILFKNYLEYLDKLIVIQPNDFTDLCNLVFNLEFLILKKEKEKDNPYKLIIIDSLTDLYRIELNRDKKETNYNLNYQLNQILANLTYLNEFYNIDILIVNETTKLRINNHFIDKQSGGQVMDYWISLDIKIERTQKICNRQILLTKHPENSQIKIESILTEKGFI